MGYADGVKSQGMLAGIMLIMMTVMMMAKVTEEFALLSQLQGPSTS